MLTVYPLHQALEIPGVQELLEYSGAIGNRVEVETREGRAVTVYSWTEDTDDNDDIGLTF